MTRRPFSNSARLIVFDNEITGRSRSGENSEAENTMRRMSIFLNLIGLLLSVNQMPVKANAALDIPVEVIEVKDLGLSDRDESKSVIEVHWRVVPVQKEKIASFNVILSVTYADGATITEKRKVERNVLSARIEVPSVRTFGGRPTAFIKKTQARVTAVISKN
jgi:hypothetical protein